MNDEFFEKQDVVLPERTRRPDVPHWDLSLRRLSKAMSILWHETPIAEQQRVLAMVDRDIKEDQ